MPPAVERCSLSLCVVNYPQSAKHLPGHSAESVSVLERGSATRWAPDSFWSGVVAMAFGAGPARR
eukprot:4009897-Alexandrium_andersonii.AAC.1